MPIIYWLITVMTVIFIIEQAKKQKINVVIPPKKIGKCKDHYDNELYKLRYLFENTFLHLKKWRGIAARYAKNTSFFLTAVQIRCITLGTNIL
ncbi:hypothetical protein SAMN05216339_1081 [Nitrosomonas eutropha]|uniref:Transposase DDE domain-containing protein n=1 Tax=Nitrosomonas eutropha TaxID=916 RepID=A0A1I7IBX3_9PROT|nr:hypothetical protein SAMN05216339_1081 [Nitrosomonas eutropha]